MNSAERALLKALIDAAVRSRTKPPKGVIIASPSWIIQASVLLPNRLTHNRKGLDQ